MPITHWVVTNMEGELGGQFSRITASNQLSSFEDYIPPAGYKKILLSHGDYEKLSSSFNLDRKIYEKHFNQATSRVREMPAARKNINEAKAKPNKYRNRTDGGGILTEEFYNTDGTLNRIVIDGVVQ